MPGPLVTARSPLGPVPASAPSRRGRGSAGTATAELAVLLPALVLLCALCVSAVGAMALHVRCLDAARTAARELARDEPPDAVLANARARAPAGAEVRIQRLRGGLVAVEVTARAGFAGWDGAGVRVGGDVVAVAEGAP